MRTEGGETFAIVGVVGIGTEPVQVYIGGRVRVSAYPQSPAQGAHPVARLQACASVTKTPENGLPAANPDATFTLSCITPPGVGASLPVVITTAGGSSPVDSSFFCSYAPPSLNNDPIVLTVGNATSQQRLLQVSRYCVASDSCVLTPSWFVQAVGGSLIPTVGGLIRLTGSFLGGTTLTSNIVILLDNGVAGSGAILAAVNFTQSTLIVAVPPGDGVNHTLQVIIGPPSGLPGEAQASNIVPLSYAPPTVESITPSFPYSAPTLVRAQRLLMR